MQVNEPKAKAQREYSTTTNKIIHGMNLSNQKQIFSMQKHT